MLKNKESLSSYFVRCNEQHRSECCRLESNHLHKPHTEIGKKKKIIPIAQNKNMKHIIFRYLSNRHTIYTGSTRQLYTRTGWRGWHARLTIGFFKSVFIFVGALPPSTVPTTSCILKQYQELEITN